MEHKAYIFPHLLWATKKEIVHLTAVHSIGACCHNKNMK